MARIVIYTTRWCGYCVRAKALLMDLTGGWTVPQILIDGRPIGGYAELWALERSGALDEAMAA